MWLDETRVDSIVDLFYLCNLFIKFGFLSFQLCARQLRSELILYGQCSGVAIARIADAKYTAAERSISVSVR